MTSVLTLLLAGALAAEPPAKAKPSRVELGREMVREVADSVGGLDPGLQPYVLFYVGRATAQFDRKKAVERLAEAWGSAQTLDDPGYAVAGMQGRIVEALAELDVARASELIRTMKGNGNTAAARNEAVHNIVGRLLRAGKDDAAIELVSGLSSSGAYPFSSVLQILTQLKAGDSRREIVFGNAMTAYMQHPSDGFAELLSEHWRTLDRASVQRALDALVGNVMDAKDSDGFQLSITGPSGKIDLPSKKAQDLFTIMAALRAIEPKRAEELVKGDPALAAALDKYPNGMESVGDAPTATISVGGSVVIETFRGPAAGGAAEKKTDTVAAIAELAEKKQGGETCDAWHALFGKAESAEVLNHEFQCADAQLAVDGDASDPNIEPKDSWPAALDYRHAMLDAEQLYGVDAAGYLARVQDRNMHALAQIAFAEVLLGMKVSSWSVGVGHNGKKEGQ